MATGHLRGKHGEVLIITLELEEFLVVGKAIRKGSQRCVNHSSLQELKLLILPLLQLGLPFPG